MPARAPGAAAPPYGTPAGTPETPEPAAGMAGRGAGGLLRAALREPGVLLGAVMLAVYVGLELSVGNWGFSYMVQARALARPLAGYPVSGYWLGLTVGRFLISPLAARAGATIAGMMYACLAGVIVATTLAWVSPNAALASVALLLLGFFLGPVFPTTMAIVPLLAPPRLAATAIGVMNAAAWWAAPGCHGWPGPSPSTRASGRSCRSPCPWACSRLPCGGRSPTGSGLPPWPAAGKRDSSGWPP